MPGILPMKVIRVGSSAQSRIAQACDRCRSKKIRCDGVRPCCTQCSNVGFECKTSDKLSRRAFPRGYTESLEDRVRQLEAEVRELKELLDEKDEKIDMLSRLQSFSPSSRKNSRSLSPATANGVKSEVRAEAEETIEVTAPMTDGTPSPVTSSSTNSFIDSFKCKASVHGRAAVGIKASNLQPIVRPSSGTTSPKRGFKAPPRLLSDQYINIFLQEWAPLFPILPRSTLLKTYQDFLQDPESSQWQNRKHDLATLFLVFDLASASAKSSKQSSVSYEHEWRRATQAMASTPSLAMLQCHVLAQLVYLLRSDHKHFLRHRASAITLCHQIGLHLSQDQLSRSASEREMRKRVFWAQYIIDRFGASSCGAPMLLRENDITTEYPADVDDENLTESTSQTSSAGETKMSNTLALIGVSRILTKVLEDIHPQAVKYNLPLKNIRSLMDEIDRWNERLPEHLRLKFVNGKPSTGIISDRSPLLALAEFYIRLLISRPIMSYASGNTASAAVLASANAAKHIAQICDLLDERSMHHAFPLCRSDVLVGAGFTLLWQSLELAPNSKLVKDNQRSIALVSQLLSKESENVGAEFSRITKSLNLPGQLPVTSSQDTTISNGSQAPTSMAAPDKISTRKHLQAIASRFSASTFGTKPRSEEARRRDTQPPMPSTQLGQYGRNFSQLSISSARSEPAYPALSPTTSNDSANSQAPVNLDYYNIGTESVPNLSSLPLKDQIDPATWEQILTSMDSGDDNIFTGVYGGLPPSEAFSSRSTEGPVNITDIDPLNLSLSMSSTTLTPHPSINYDDSSFWSQDTPAWQNAVAPTSLVDLQDIHHPQSNHSTSVAPQSVVSYTSEDSSAQSTGTSTDDYLSLTSAMNNSNYSNTSASRSSGSSKSTTTMDNGNPKRSSSSGGQSLHHLPLLKSSTSIHHTNSFDGLDTHSSDKGHVAPDLSSTYGGIVMPNLADNNNHGWD